MKYGMYAQKTILKAIACIYIYIDIDRLEISQEIVDV